MAEEPIWLLKQAILQIHAEQLAEHGGIGGLRDDGLLDSALARAQNKFQYGEDNIAAIAAAYAYGVARNHPFLDGNKRTAYVAMEMFLLINGFDFTASDDDAIAMFLSLASGQVSEDRLGVWIGDYLLAIDAEEP